MTTIKVGEAAGGFAQNKDVARRLRLEALIPALGEERPVLIDFEGVDLTTQSFIHALLSDVIRQLGAQVLERITFTNCNDEVQALIEIVSEYSQEGL